MAASLETNKIVGAILTGLLIATASGNLARFIYVPHHLEEPVYRVVEVEREATQHEVAAATKPLAVLLAEASPADGEKVAKKCTACHSFDKGGPTKVGPNLFAIIGRPLAADERFAYSEALKSFGGAWTFERLDAYLADPRGYIPGTKMSFAGLKKAEERAALLAWLRLQADEPVPLPAVGNGGDTSAKPKLPAAEPEMPAGTTSEGSSKGEAEPTLPAAPPAMPSDREAAAPPMGSPGLLRAAVAGYGQRIARASLSANPEETTAHEGGPNLGSFAARRSEIAGRLPDFPGRAAMAHVSRDARLGALLAAANGLAPATRIELADRKDPERFAARLAAWRSLAH